MEKPFINKIALVTGASSGIGRATAIAFAKKGAKIVALDCKENNETINLIKELGSDAIFIKCDVSKSSDVKTMIEKAIATFGQIDYAFNNAGIEGTKATTWECSEENWDKTIGINLKGIWLCMKHEIPEMLKLGKGVIINCASVAGLIGFNGLPAYVSSKHGVVGLTKTAALECATHGIRVNVVCPGVIQTPMIDRLTGKTKESIQQFTALEPMGRFGLPEEIANAVVWLCSDEASFVTGHAMAVDGGFVAQ
jgi:NAD(P)-dependent dehydrogenase (short-subunit alcohol dehydrogenase family)